MPVMNEENKYMTNEEFEEYLSNAHRELNEKQERLRLDYDIGSLPRWWFDQDTEQLQFHDSAGNVAIVANVIPIGSFSPNSNTWKWAWCNESLTSSLRKKSLPLKQLESITGFKVFVSEEPCKADEYIAWELAALGVMHLKAMGCYRAPSSNGLQSFLAITTMRKVLQ
jgi:hypothetical protein